MIETPDTNKETPSQNQTVHTVPFPQTGNKTAEESQTDLDFVVTEAHDQASDLVGGFNSTKGDDLGIESPADLMEAEAAREVGERHLPDPVQTVPIGDTTPPPPPPADKPLDSDSGLAADITPYTNQTATSRTGLERLSEERLQEISQQMKSGTPTDDYLSTEEKQRLIKSIDETSVDETTSQSITPKVKTGFDNKPIVLPSKQKNAAEASPLSPDSDSAPTQQSIALTGDQPKISNRVRGVAHFAREYIKITGGQQLHEGDTLTINSREYMLRPKKFSNRLIIGIVAPLAAILIFALGTLLSSDANTGAGEIVGMVLSDTDQPYISGTEIRFPELETSFLSNGQGFFKTDPLDAGTYKIEFLYDGQVIATDYATVVADQITTITMRPEPLEAQPTVVGQATRPIAQPEQVTPTRTPPAAKPSPPAKTTKAKTISSASSNSRWAKLGLEANVEGAKLTVDGTVLGAGNLTYPRLKPGIHQYVVSKDGYQSYRGSVDLKAGKTKTINVTLTPEPIIAQPITPPEQILYSQGLEALDKNESATAISSFNEAIKINPSYVNAYLGRAQAHLLIKDSRAAHDDYVRAAEISNFHDNFNQAISSYKKALKLNAKSIPAFLGRGNLYLARGEEIAAVADFDMVVRLDKRNIDGYLGLGQARYDQGYFKKAIKHFKDARSINSKNPIPHRLLMMSYYRTGEFKQVKKSYEKFVKYASEAELQQLNSDPRFTTIIKIAKD